MVKYKHREIKRESGQTCFISLLYSFRPCFFFLSFQRTYFSQRSIFHPHPGLTTPYTSFYLTSFYVSTVLFLNLTSTLPINTEFNFWIYKSKCLSKILLSLKTRREERINRRQTMKCFSLRLFTFVFAYHPLLSYSLLLTQCVMNCTYKYVYIYLYAYVNICIYKYWRYYLIDRHVFISI